MNKLRCPEGRRRTLPLAEDARRRIMKSGNDGRAGRATVMKPLVAIATVEPASRMNASRRRSQHGCGSDRQGLARAVACGSASAPATLWRVVPDPQRLVLQTLRHRRAGETPPACGAALVQYDVGRSARRPDRLRRPGRGCFRISVSGEATWYPG